MYKTHYKSILHRLTMMVVSLLMLASPLLTMASTLLGYQEPDSGARVEATLYFRYMDSPYLGQETRVIHVPRTQNLEQALVQALLDGPKGTEGFYRSLFPQGTKVLNVQNEGGRLFVSLSSEVMNSLPGEDGLNQQSRENAVLRRRLALSSLVNTLTESSSAHSVQVLVLGEPGPEQSLRLSMRYYLEDSDLIPSPLTRNEADILTPGAAARMIFKSWQERQWNSFQSLLAVDTPLGQAGISSSFFAEFPAINSLKTTEGNVSPDGSYALITLDAGLLAKDGREIALTAFPIKLFRSTQGWKLAYSSLMNLLEAAQ